MLARVKLRVEPLEDRLTPASWELISAATDGSESNGNSLDRLSVSADGRYVVFTSAAPDLVAGDANGQFDVFLRDRLTGTTELVSVAVGGGPANGRSRAAAVSGDGRYVVFMSAASDLVAGDAAGSTDVFIRDRLTGATERVNVPAPGGSTDVTEVYDSGTELNYAAVSADGRFVAFVTEAGLVAVDTNGEIDVYVRDRVAGTTELVSVTPGGAAGGDFSGFPSISGDGRFVAFYSAASDLTPGDTNLLSDAFLRDRLTGTTTRIVLPEGLIDGPGLLTTGSPAISADGRFVAISGARIGPGGPAIEGSPSAVFVYDRVSGAFEAVSVGPGGDVLLGSFTAPSISADGRYVAYTNSPYLFGEPQILVRDRVRGTTEVVSPVSDPSWSYQLFAGSAVGVNGRTVVFSHAPLGTDSGGTTYYQLYARVLGLDPGGPYEGGVGDTLTLSATVGPDVNPATVSWDIDGDGVFGDATGLTPTLGTAQFAALGLGRHLVRFRANDVQGQPVGFAVATIDVRQRLVAVESGGGVVAVSDLSGSRNFTLTPYGSGWRGGVSVATADVNRDGVDDIITGAGAGGTPHVKVFDGASGREIASFYAYDPGFGGGVVVAVADVDRDGVPDIVTGAGPGSTPHVKVFKLDGLVELASFYAYDPGFTGGVTVAADNGVIVTGSGPGSAPHVKTFRLADGRVLETSSFYAFDPSFTGGVSVAAAGKLIGVGAGPGGGPQVRLFQPVQNALFISGPVEQVASFYAFAPSYTGGVRLGSRGGVDPVLYVDAKDGDPAGVKVFDLTGRERPTSSELSRI